MNYENKAVIEVQEIIRTVEFEVASNRRFRLEVVKVEKGTADIHFGVHYYERQTLYKSPVGTITSESIAGAPQFDVWVPDLDLPWVNKHSAAAALQQGLDWLADRRNNQNMDWVRGRPL